MFLCDLQKLCSKRQLLASGSLNSVYIFTIICVFFHVLPTVPGEWWLGTTGNAVEFWE